MRVLYLSSVVSDKLFKSLFEQGRTTGYVGQKYHGLFVKGLAKNLSKDTLTVLSQPPTHSASIKLQERQGNVAFRYIPVIPIPILKTIIASIYSFFYALWWCIKNLSDKKVIVCSVMRIYQFLPIIPVSHLFSCKRVSIVCDIPWMTINQVQSHVTLKQKVTIAVSKWLSQGFDAYVFLTESMNSIMNKNGRPYVVVEGFCDSELANRIDQPKEKKDKFIVMYAGGLNKAYGIESLVEACSSFDSNLELWLFGKGDMDNSLYGRKNVRFLGAKQNSDIVIAEMRADILINPRPTEGEYTRYSFPSKTIEYMASGTYTLTTKLEGIPEEYFRYCGVIEDSSVNGIKTSICKAISLGKEELWHRGMIGREFVLQNKNNVKQCQRVLAMVENLW